MLQYVAMCVCVCVRVFVCECACVCVCICAFSTHIVRDEVYAFYDSVLRVFKDVFPSLEILNTPTPPEGGEGGVRFLSGVLKPV